MRKGIRSAGLAAVLALGACGREERPDPNAPMVERNRDDVNQSGIEVCGADFDHSDYSRIVVQVYDNEAGRDIKGITLTLNNVIVEYNNRERKIFPTGSFKIYPDKDYGGHNYGPAQAAPMFYVGTQIKNQPLSVAVKDVEGLGTTIAFQSGNGTPTYNFDLSTTPDHVHIHNPTGATLNVTGLNAQQSSVVRETAESRKEHPREAIYNVNELPLSKNVFIEGSGRVVFTLDDGKVEDNALGNPNSPAEMAKKAKQGNVRGG
jgi:hypothetical protein